MDLSRKKILLQDLNLLKSLVVLGFHLDRSDRSTLPVRPVGCCRTDYSVWPVRPLGRTGQTGRYCRMPILVVNISPLFFGKACVPKNTLLNQNCLRAITIYRPYLASSSSWWWNNLFGLPYLLHGRRPCWYNLCLLFHGFFLAHPLQPPLLGVRQTWRTPLRL